MTSVAGKQQNALSDSKCQQKLNIPEIPTSITTPKQIKKSKHSLKQNNITSSDIVSNINYLINDNTKLSKVLLDKTNGPTVSLKKDIFNIPDINNESHLNKIRLNRSKPVDSSYNLERVKKMNSAEILDDNVFKFPFSKNFETGLNAKEKFVNLANIIHDNDNRANDSCASCSKLSKNVGSKNNSRVLESTAL